MSSTDAKLKELQRILSLKVAAYKRYEKYDRLYKEKLAELKEGE
jgi:hypothetical protein